MDNFQNINKFQLHAVLFQIIFWVINIFPKTCFFCLFWVPFFFLKHITFCLPFEAALFFSFILIYCIFVLFLFQFDGALLSRENNRKFETCFNYFQGKPSVKLILQNRCGQCLYFYLDKYNTNHYWLSQIVL